MNFDTTPFEEAGPRADAMLETLRSIGYTLDTAVADIIDNSIAAGATDVQLEIVWQGQQSTLTISDNGRGMDAEALREAMRPGSRHPGQVRHKDDLGRFGLGLKTASFSQCRRFTVLSKPKGGEVTFRCWDLDYVNESKAWNLLCHVSDETLIEQLDAQPQGTIVFWEKMDRLIGNLQLGNQKHEAIFGQYVKLVEHHLSMVFHRYLEDGSLTVYVNGEKLSPWDPFLTAEPFTQRLIDETLLGGQVVIRPYILPHHRRLSHPDLFEEAGGLRGWGAHQGFYIYRNRRLLVAGDWLGMFRREEHCKLARIMVDLPNTLDDAWQIDIRKAQSFPPTTMQSDFRRIGTLARTRAVEVYRARGRKLKHTHSIGFTPVWQENVRLGQRHYTINRQHPLVKDLLEKSKGQTSALLHAVLRMFEETIPVPLIVLSEAEKPREQAVPYENVGDEEVLPLLQDLFRDFRAAGRSATDVRQMLQNMEPFNYFPHLIDKLPDA
ncbi:ATP-binding protein [Hymenobacter edaphi]|uniref:ATP-binding protein n=1 Tax=Hymenobacter edaphi TaxID=2211146 RepID=A0A328B7L8_9BACT|nr:ATP-binding protein [Hymenobacter edaphi]RAK62411.1 ATP-binding protein [Hymenobacter edaphi]